ncbi:MAG: amidohydrolase [Terriglobia bacterium]
MKKLWMVLLVSCVSSSLAFAQGPDLLKRDALQEAEALESTIDRIATELWEYAETALRENRSAALLVDTLEAAGFTVERGVAGMPTAFVATYGEGSPVIGILAEYDALPGVGNAAVPERQRRPDGVTSGHGCGHNLFGAGSVGGALALKRLLEKHGLRGTLKLFGTPAEETVVGKVYMARAGLFAGLDAVLEWHPGTENEVRNQPGRAMNNFTVEFFGQAAHAAADPWNGRSALDAVEQMNFAVNLMREHVKPTTRLHYVILSGGEAPNVVPEYAKVWYYVRDINRKEVKKHYDRLQKIAEAAALATGTTYKLHLITGVHEYLLNRPLQEAVQANLERVGAPRFTEPEQAFGRRLQQFLQIEEKGFSTTVKPLADEPQPVSGGSTDVAEVSWITPTVGFRIATAAEDVPWHSWATTACHGTTAARKAAVLAAKVIAATGVDLLTQPELVSAAKAFLQKATGGKPYESPLPPDQPPPLPARD